MSEPANPREQIIVVEDSPPNRKILCHLVEKLGFESIACEDGQAALEKIKSATLNRLRAILSDVMMPEMDGLTLLKSVRELPGGETLPFVLVTAMSDKEYIVKAKALNVNGYILKPVTFEKVEMKLKELFPLRKFPKVAA